MPAQNARTSGVQIFREYVRDIRDPSESAVAGSGVEQSVALGVDAAAIVLVLNAQIVSQLARGFSVDSRKPVLQKSSNIARFPETIDKIHSKRYKAIIA